MTINTGELGTKRAPCESKWEAWNGRLHSTYSSAEGFSNVGNSTAPYQTLVPRSSPDERVVLSP